MGRKSRATLNRITNLNGTHDSEERPTKRQKTSSSAVTAVPSGKENIQVSGILSQWYVKKSFIGDTYFCQVQISIGHIRANACR